MLEKERLKLWERLLKLYKPSSPQATDMVSALASCLGKDPLHGYKICVVPICEPSNDVTLADS